ncbi:MAG: FliM/FliN family flagellar motor switch protein [SAR324 cluster bacterium]|nr:FliM/FliN family flagellar motor switch protein [SAR324 cluster bacterium]
MAKGNIESEEELNDQFVLDDDLDDLSLDDDELFADLDNEIRLDGGKSATNGTLDSAEADAASDDLGDLDLDLGSDEPAAEAAGDDLGDLDLDLGADEPAAEAAESDGLEDLSLDLDGEDMAALDISQESAAPQVEASAGESDGLDDLMSSESVDDGLDDLVPSESAGDGLDDLMPSESAGDGLDDLMAAEETEGDMDDLTADADEAPSGESVKDAPEDISADESSGDLLSTPETEEAMDEIIGDGGDEQEESAETIDLNAMADELTFDESGEDELSVDLDSNGDTGEVSVEPDSESGFSMDDLGDETLEIPSLEAGDPAEAAVADLSLNGVDDMDFSAVEEETQGEGFEAAPDVDIGELDAHLDALDASILEEDEYDEEEELPIEFTPEELVDMGAEEEEPSETPFSAVDDVELGEGDLMELNVASLQPGGAPSPVSHAQELPAGGISPDILLSIPHQVSVEIGSISLKGKDIMELDYGSVVPLDRTVGEPVDLVLEGKAIAQGEIVLINGKNLGVRIVAVNK